MGGAVLFFPSYLAAIRPSSIRHRHTSRGCLWRTSRRRTNKDGRGIEMFFKKVIYLKGKMFPEINYLCQKETGAAVWTERAHFRRYSVSIVRRYLWSWAGIPVGSGCAAEGIRARKLHQQASPLPIGYIKKGPCLCALSLDRKSQLVCICSFVKVKIG